MKQQLLFIHFLIASPYWGGDDDWQAEVFTLKEGFASRLPSGMPIFLYHSRDDEVVPFTHLNLYAEKLPQATVHEIDDRGHQFKNNLLEVVEDIKSCLDPL